MKSLVTNFNLRYSPFGNSSLHPIISHQFFSKLAHNILLFSKHLLIL